jgi:protein gp37
MSDKSHIEWTEATWNPVRGCIKISPGCKHCYAEVFAERFRGVPGHPYEQGFDLRIVPEALELPKQWRRGRLVFVNSMSDLFQDKVSLDYIQQVFAVMRETKQHTYQVLTKRSERLAQVCTQLEFTQNIWMGVSVENAKYIFRIDDLRKTQAHIKFLSLEPLLGPLPQLDLRGIHWVIVGGESGHGARPIDPSWVVDIRDQCCRAGVPFFFKQWGGANKKKTGRLLEGQTWNEMPRALR